MSNCASVAKRYANNLRCTAPLKIWKVTHSLLSIFSLSLLSAGIHAPTCLASTVAPSFDLNEITQYQDSLSPDDYASLSERARQLQAQLHANAPRTIDASEYKQAIQTLKADTREKVEERHNELDQSTKQVNDEIERINRTYESYARDLSDQQKDELDHDMQDLLQRWKSPAPNQKGVNQGLKECGEYLEQLHKINDRIIDSSMSKAPKEKASEKDIVPFADEIEMEGKRLPVRRTSRQGLRCVNFTLGEREYAAIEQNPENPSRWGELARSGHQVVQFRDVQTNRFVAVAVDGEAMEYGGGRRQDQHGDNRD